MKRIDSVNARPDMFGAGKNGFHDNADLQGQDATYLTPDWLNMVQEELANTVEGFKTDLDPENNKQLFNILLDMTKDIKNLKTELEEDLKKLREEFESVEDVAVGDLYITTLHFTSADKVAEHKGFGKWQAYGDGHALVSIASNEQAPSWMKAIGNTGGEYTHQLTTEELPKFRLKNGMVDDGQGDASGHVYGYTQEDLPGLAVGRAETSGGTGGGWQGFTSYIGDDKAHNNVQPSIVVACWVRVE